jgi:hypothetical protein
LPEDVQQFGGHVRVHDGLRWAENIPDDSKMVPFYLAILHDGRTVLELLEQADKLEHALHPFRRLHRTENLVKAVREGEHPFHRASQHDRQHFFAPRLPGSTLQQGE